MSWIQLETMPAGADSFRGGASYHDAITPLYNDVVMNDEDVQRPTGKRIVCPVYSTPREQGKKIVSANQQARLQHLERERVRWHCCHGRSRTCTQSGAPLRAALPL